MALPSRSGKRLSALAAVEEFLPPRERHARGFVGGGVGDAVTIKAGQALPLAGRTISFYTFAKNFCHVITLAF